MPGRYCAMFLRVSSTGRPSLRAKSCTWALPMTAFNCSVVIGWLAPGPSQDCTWAPSPPFSSAATSPLRSRYCVCASTLLIAVERPPDPACPRRLLSMSPSPKLSNKPMFALFVTAITGRTGPDYRPLSPALLPRRNDKAALKPCQHDGRSLVEACSLYQRPTPGSRQFVPYFRSSESGTLPPFSASFCMTCLCSQRFIVAESFLSPVKCSSSASSLRAVRLESRLRSFIRSTIDFCQSSFSLLLAASLVRMASTSTVPAAPAAPAAGADDEPAGAAPGVAGADGVPA